jgi:xanthine dehydrogenase accessory factor
MMEPRAHVVARTAAPAEVLRTAVERVEAGERVAVATVVRRRGSSPSTPGQKLVLFGDGALGTVGGGAVELRVLEAMAALLDEAEPQPRLESYDLGPSLGMCCGGSVEILLEVLEPAFAVVVIGAGHVGRALAPLLCDLGFRVTLADAREDVVGAVVARPHLCVVCAEHDDPEASPAGDVARAAALVMTHDHQLDQAAIEHALRRGFGFVGGVGSRAKAARTRARLEAKGFAAADVDRVRMPLGVDIGARLPAEIAVAVAGELVRWRADLVGQVRRRDAHAAHHVAPTADAEE